MDKLRIKKKALRKLLLWSLFILSLFIFPSYMNSVKPEISDIPEVSDLFFGEGDAEFKSITADSIIFCDSILYQGQWYWTSALIIDTNLNQQGFDSIHYQYLIQNTSPLYGYAEFDPLCGDTVILFEDTITQSFYGNIYWMVDGDCWGYYVVFCPIPTYTYNHYQEEICEGDYYILNNDTLYTEGSYIDSLYLFPDKCDSLVSLSLTVHPNYSEVVYDTFCIGYDYFFVDEYLTDTGYYCKTLNTVHGCDSLIELYLANYPEVTLSMNAPFDSLLLQDTIIQLDFAYPQGGYYRINGAFVDSINPIDLGLGSHLLTYIYSDGHCFTEESMDIVVYEELHININPTEEQYGFCFPNPVNNELWIQLNSNIQVKTYSIYNSTGKKVLQGTYRNPIDVSALQNGSYFMILKSADTGSIELSFVKM